MKLDWEINEFRVLKAKVGEVTYYVAPGGIDLWRPHKQYTAFDGKVATVWPVEGGMSLTNAIAWCERDVERPEGCPAQPPAIDPVAPKTSGGMSKFPNTLDASVWSSRATAWFGAFKVPDLTEWFQAALSFAYEEGQKAGASRTMTVSQYLAWKQTNAAPPSAQAPEPPSVEEQIENLAWGLKSEIKRAAERDNEIAERLGAYEAWLTQFVASKCQALDLRINERLKKLEAKA